MNYGYPLGWGGWGNPAWSGIPVTTPISPWGVPGASVFGQSYAQIPVTAVGVTPFPGAI